MVFGSSVNPLDTDYKNAASPYEAALANVSALHARGFECSTPASPSRNSDSHAVPAPLITATHQHERAASPSPSSDSAGGAAATPPADRPALGRFSASFPQFVSHSMSPLDPVTASATYSDGIRGPAAGFTTMPPSYEQHAPNSEQLMVAVHPGDLQPPADIAAAVTAVLDAAPAPAAAAPPPRRVIGFEEEGALGPSLPPLAPPAPAATATHPQHCYPSHATSRPRHGSATTISYGPAGYPPPSPGDAATPPLLGMSPSGSLTEHITRAASLPLLMCNAVLPPGASPAIPIAIAGVGASGRARATTVHTPLTVSGGGAGASMSCSASTAGIAGASGVAGGHRGVTQSVDHHLMQRHIAAQAQQQQQQFYHQSDGGGGAVSSPVHFVGSVSPSATTASFHTAFPGPPSGPGTLSGEEVGQPPSADRRPDVLATAAGPAAAAAAAAAACRGGEVEIELDLMERESSLTSGSRELRVPQLEVGLVGAAPVGAAPVGAAGAGAAAVATTGRDTDGDEEFQDAVEVQHDDDDHVSFHDQMVLGGRSPAGARPPHGGGGGGGAHFHAHNHHDQHQHRLQRCNYAVGEPYSPEALSRQPTCVSSGGDAQVHQIHGLQEQQQDLQQHSAPLPVATVGGVVVYRHEYEEESGDHILEDGSYPRRHGRIVTAAEDDEEDDEGGAADLEEDEEDVFNREEEEVLDEDEEDEVLVGDEDLAFGGGGRAGGGGFTAAEQLQYVAPAVLLEPHICVNCTRPFYGATCRCGHPADAEVVVSELLEGAVQSMLAGEAAAAASTHHQQQQPHGPVGHGAGVLLAYDDRCRAHLEEASPGVSPDQGRSHPERPERVAAIMARLQATGLLARFARTVGREATLPELVAVHDAELVSELEARTAEVARVAQQRAAARAAAASGDAAAAGQDSDMGDECFVMQRSAHVLDCYFNAATAGCARLAAGSAAEVARRVVSGAARHGAAIIRPPGHHAESSVAMGFCYYNNAAVAARAAQAAGAARVLIMDWDVHHGNGTQRIFYDDPSVLYMSTHRYDGGNFYPGTGDASETGSGPGVGFTVNVPWNRSGVRDADMLAAFRHVIIPIATEFRPDLVIVSAGFDAAEGDPLGGCLVSTAAFSHFAALLSGLAPTVLLLEGGYNLTATAAATEACLRVLLGEPPAPLPDGLLRAGPAVGPLAADPTADPWVATGLEGVSESALDSVRLVLRVQSQFWLSARENLVAVEAAIEERRHRQLMRLQQQQPLQPREQWGWHVQMPAASPMLQPQQPAPVAAAASPPPGVVQLAGAAGAFHGGSPPSPAVATAAVVVATEHFLEGPEMEAVETRRRMDLSSSGVMDLGEQGVLGGGGTDVHMG